MTVSDRRNLRTRVLSAVVLLPPVMLAAWFSEWSFAILAAILSGAMAWEWSRLCGAGRTMGLLLPALAATVPLLAQGADTGLALTVLAAMVPGLALCGRALGDTRPLALALGLPYVALAGVAAVWLRGAPDGLIVLIWMIVLVSATDIGAYFMGRRVGGPKLAPRISPNKTWSGFIGGAGAAVAVGISVAVLRGMPVLPIAALSLFLSLLAQAGDLIESALKRGFRVKDASNLIPGHGGILDRLDGYLTALPAAALMSWGFGGSLLQWQ